MATSLSLLSLKDGKPPLFPLLLFGKYQVYPLHVTSAACVEKESGVDAG